MIYIVSSATSAVDKKKWGHNFLTEFTAHPKGIANQWRGVFRRTHKFDIDRLDILLNLKFFIFLKNFY